jgi:NAD(P)-dependent dehydrogenase (short-subunit alcohol dehydrogenase family)
VDGAVTVQGRVALVTGAGQGVGRGIALALASAGAAVVVAARRAETGEPVAAEVRGRGGEAVCVETDVAVRGDVERAVAIAVERYGRLDVVVHNAFSGRGSSPHRLVEAEPDLWEEFSRTAMWASLFCAQAALPHLAAAGGAGRLILLTSTSGIEGSAAIPLYSAVKGAQRAFAKSLAREWGHLGITVNCIAPVALSPAMERALVANPELRPRLEARTPAGRLGDPEADVGAVAVFLAGDGGRYVNGQTIVCDGGSFTGL